ncbi:MAG: ATP-binding cassette domain-containing protein [Actinomycetota bacterium]|nr:ATP-binding cassette domain-containing protein [Actinomycetota bacterium]
MNSPPSRGKIEIENVSYAYPQEVKPALSDINFTFEAGAFYCILGKNGSGKSTLLRCINALVIPDKGKISICEFDTSDEKTITQARKSVSMVFQNPQTQLIAPTVEEEVAFGPENLGLEAREIAERVEEALHLTGTKHLSNRPTECLSLGEKQLVAMAGVLAMRPAFLLSDESTSMLDSGSRARILNLFAKLRESRIGVVHVTHFVEEAIKADKVLILEEGRLVKSGNPQETLGNPEEVAKFGIEPLPVTLIARELQLLGYSLGNAPLQPDDLILWTL